VSSWLQKISLDSDDADSFSARTSDGTWQGALPYGVAARSPLGSVSDSNSSSMYQPAAAYPVDARRSDSPEPEGQTTLADVLLRAGVYPTDRPRREDLAGELLTQGWSAGDIGMVAQRVMQQAGNPRIGLATLLKLLRAKDRLREAIEDCRALGRWEAGSTRRWHPGEADRMRTAKLLEDERRRWADAAREHWIRCRVRDGVPEAVAEAEWVAKKRQS
jgi:hypothetical protein